MHKRAKSKDLLREVSWETPQIDLRKNHMGTWSDLRVHTAGQATSAATSCVRMENIPRCTEKARQSAHLRQQRNPSISSKHRKQDRSNNTPA